MRIKKNKQKPKTYKKPENDVKIGIKETLKKVVYKRKLLVEMILFNSDKEFFIAKINDDNTFKYKNKKYLVDERGLVYYKSFREWGGLYHENLSIPIKQNIDTNKIIKTIEKQAINDESLVEAISNIRPKTLNAFSDTKVIEDSIKGANASKVINLVKILVIINTIALAIVMVLLNNIKPIF